MTITITKESIIKWCVYFPIVMATVVFFSLGILIVRVYQECCALRSR